MSAAISVTVLIEDTANQRGLQAGQVGNLIHEAPRELSISTERKDEVEFASLAGVALEVHHASVRANEFPRNG